MYRNEFCVFIFYYICLITETIFLSALYYMHFLKNLLFRIE